MNVVFAAGPFRKISRASWPYGGTKWSILMILLITFLVDNVS